MNWVDILFSVILTVIVARGFLRGLIRSVFDIVALALAIYLSFVFYGDAARLIAGYVALPENILFALGFLAIWLATFMLVAVAGEFCHKILGHGILWPFNVLGGGLLGLIKALLIIWLILQMLFMIPLTPEMRASVKESKSIATMKPIFDAMPFDFSNVSMNIDMIYKDPLQLNKLREHFDGKSNVFDSIRPASKEAAAVKKK